VVLYFNSDEAAWDEWGSLLMPRVVEYLQGEADDPGRVQRYEPAADEVRS
jgi:hypothetical protein